MLNCYVIESPDQKQNLFQEFLTRESLWIVNDLESKFWIQRLLRLNLKGVIHTDPVQRASEVWQSLLLRMDPAWQPLSGLLAELLIEKWVGQILKEQNLKISQKDSARAYQTIGQILPLLSHFQGEDVMGEWFSQKEDAKERWADWYDLGRLLWQRFLDQRLIPQEWMKGVLINEELPFLGEQPIVVDLGLDIDDVESELLLNLSRQHNVNVFVPAQEVDKEAYLNLLNRSQQQHFNKKTNSLTKNYRKLPSMLAEVKEAVGQVRSWLDEGIDVDKIAIISPQIENYWPTLQEHLRVEGVPVQKALVTPLTQIPVYQDLLARIRLASQKLLNGDSELIFYKKNQTPGIDYRSFQSLFTNVYRMDDFSRSEEVGQSFPDVIDPLKEISLEVFLENLSQWLPIDSIADLENLIQELDEVFILNEKLSFEKWVQFLERYFARTEKKIMAAAEFGIHVLPLKASQNFAIRRAVVLGLSEGQLLENKNTALSWLDIKSIKLNFGFNLAHADRHLLEDHLRWFEKKEIDTVVYTHAETDFNGRYQSPSMFWLQGAIASGHSLVLDSPQSTRWDELNKSQPGVTTPLRTSDREKSLDFINRDQGQRSFAKVPYKRLSLSASSFEEFFKCPFKLFARKGLGLGNPPVLDLDIDYMTRGRLLHRVCEVVVQEKLFNLNDDSIFKLIDKARADIEMKTMSDQLWGFLRPYYAQATKAFIKFEKQWRENYPQTQTLAVEQRIKTHLKQVDNQIVFDAEEGIPFRGVIDRIDTNDQGQVVIIDYKSSDSGLTQYTSWLKNGKIQLALYSLALIEGVLGGKQHDVIGAFYFVLKTLERNKGFVLQEGGVDFLPTKKMQREELETFLEETRELVGLMLKDILAGQVEPSPQNNDLRICEKCDWKRLCRNPELNH